MGLVVEDDGWRIPDTLWHQVESLLPAGKPHPLGCHRPRVDNRRALEGILFVLRTGCQWGALDATDICKHSSAHRRFQEWVAAGVFGQLWTHALQEYDALKGIKWECQALDGALTKAPLGGKKSGPNPTDRAKRGTKRSVLTEAAGVPIGVIVAGANVNDSKLVAQTLESIPVERPEATPPGSPDAPESAPAASPAAEQGLYLDAGYDDDEVRTLAAAFGYTTHICSRGEEAQTIKREVGYAARRWVVERTHSWLNRFRGILIRWNKKPENYVGLLHLACAIITYRAADLLG